MRHRIVAATFALLLVAGCNESANSTSADTCATVSITSERIANAAGAELGSAQVFTQALAIYRYQVTPGMRLTATLDVPDDKDYQMAFFDTLGNRLSCSENAGVGVDESMQLDVGSRTEVLVRVWTAASPSSSSFTLLVEGVAPTPVAEQEPNDTTEAAQLVEADVSTVTGGVDSEGSDPDDYFAYPVAQGDVVTVDVNLTSGPDGLVYVALQDAAGNTLTVGDEQQVFSFEETATSASFTYTVPADMDVLIVWMSGIPGAADYTIETAID